MVTEFFLEIQTESSKNKTNKNKREEQQQKKTSKALFSQKSEDESPQRHSINPVVMDHFNGKQTLEISRQDIHFISFRFAMNIHFG